MNKYYIVCGREKRKGARKKRYIKKVSENNKITYHNFKEEIYCFQTKYKGGCVSFFNVGKKEIDIEVIGDNHTLIDNNKIAIGFNF